MTAPPTEPRDFSSFLLELARGKTHEELSRDLQAVVAKVTETGKKGSLTLTLSIELLDKDPANGVRIVDEIKTKLPEHDRPSSMFFPTSDGNLSRRDPRQMSFDDLPTLPEPEGLNYATGEIPKD